MSALENPDVPPDLLIALMVPTLWSALMTGRQANVCVDACRILQHAYGQFGMPSELHAVSLDVVDARGDVIHHAPEPSWEGTVLDGHCILYLPDDCRFVDATVEQYRQVAHRGLGVLVGRVGGFPEGSAKDRAAFEDSAALPSGAKLMIQRKDLRLEYRVGDEAATQVIVSHPVVADNVAAHRRAGINLASLTFEFIRVSGWTDRARAAPYPRLRALLDIVRDAPAEPDENGDWRFDLATGDGEEHRLRLDEIVLSGTVPPAANEDGPVAASPPSLGASRSSGAEVRTWRRRGGQITAGSPPDSYQLRIARPGESEGVNFLLGLAGVELNVFLEEAVEDETISSALIRAARSGNEEILRELVSATDRGDPNLAMPGLSTVVVAEVTGGALAGAALALPPFAVFAEAANTGLATPWALAGLAAVVKIKGVGVAEHARRGGIGSALIRYCTNRYLSLGYHLVYGQIRVGSGLEAFYPRLGFDVMAVGEHVSLEALSLPIAISPEPGERLILHWG